MALLGYEKVSVERDSKGEETITIHLSGDGMNQFDKRNYELMLDPNEWFNLRNDVNKLLGER